MGMNIRGDIGPFHFSAPVGRYGADSAKGLGWLFVQTMRWSVYLLAVPFIAVYWLGKGAVKGIALAVPPLGRALETDDPVVQARRRRVVGYLGAVVILVTAVVQFGRIEIGSGLALMAVASGVGFWAHRQVPRYA